MEGNISQADDPSKFGITEPDGEYLLELLVPYISVFAQEVNFGNCAENSHVYN